MMHRYQSDINPDATISIRYQNHVVMSPARTRDASACAHLTRARAHSCERTWLDLTEATIKRREVGLGEYLATLLQEMEPPQVCKGRGL